MSITLVASCPKCVGCLESETDYQWRCINCGKRLWRGSIESMIRDPLTKYLDQHYEDIYQGRSKQKHDHISFNNQWD